MNFKVLKRYIDICKSMGISPSWSGLKDYKMSLGGGIKNVTSNMD